MQTTWRVRTTVLPGQRIEVSGPDLPEGTAVDVIVMLPEPPCPDRRTILDFLDSLPPGPRSYPSWDDFEADFQAERNAWER